MKVDKSLGLIVIIGFCVASIVTILFGLPRQADAAAESSSAEKPKVITVEHSDDGYTYEWEREFFEQVSAQVDVIPEYKCLGEFRLTVYTPYEDKYGYQTATGERSQHLMTCAVDPDVIPYGSTVIIGGKDGLRLKAIDCGSKVNGKHIDIFFDGSEEGGIEWLTENYGDYCEVWIDITKGVND